MIRLIAGVKAVLRRPGGVLGIPLAAGNVSLDTVGRELTVAGTPVRVSRRELAILEQMMRRFGPPVPKTGLGEKLYGVPREPHSNTVPPHGPPLPQLPPSARPPPRGHTLPGV